MISVMFVGGIPMGRTIRHVSKNMCSVRGHMFIFLADRAFNMLLYCCCTFNLLLVAISVVIFSYLALVSLYNFTRKKFVWFYMHAC